MSTIPTLRCAYVTLPSSTEPVLNIIVGEQHAKFNLTRDQLYNLNCDIADALCRGRISRPAPVIEQHELPLFAGPGN